MRARMVNNAAPLMISSEWRNLQPTKQMREINKRWMLQYKQEASLYSGGIDRPEIQREREREREKERDCKNDIFILPP